MKNSNKVFSGIFYLKLFKKFWISRVLKKEEKGVTALVRHSFVLIGQSSRNQTIG